MSLGESGSRQADELYDELNEQQIEVLYDDRNERPGVKFALFVFEKPFGDAGVNVVFLQSEPSARDDQDVVIAHEKGRHSVIPPAVAIDVCISSITAVKNDHYAVFYFISDDLYKLM